MMGTRRDDECAALSSMAVCAAVAENAAAHVIFEPSAVVASNKFHVRYVGSGTYGQVYSVAGAGAFVVCESAGPRAAPAHAHAHAAGGSDDTARTMLRIHHRLRSICGVPARPALGVVVAGAQVRGGGGQRDEQEGRGREREDEGQEARGGGEQRRSADGATMLDAFHQRTCTLLRHLREHFWADHPGDAAVCKKRQRPEERRGSTAGALHAVRRLLAYSPCNQVALKVQTHAEDEYRSIGTAVLREVAALIRIGEHPNVVPLHAVFTGFCFVGGIGSFDYTNVPTAPDSDDECARLAPLQSRCRPVNDEGGALDIVRASTRAGTNPRSCTMVMEYYECRGKSRSVKVDTLGELRELARGLVFAVHAVHGCGLMHRDIKCDNVLWKGRPIRAHEVALADFGHSRLLQHDRSLRYVQCSPAVPEPTMNTIDVCTLNYRAPEILLRCRRYTSAMDMWSVGATLIEFATGVFFGYEVDGGTTEAGVLMSIFSKLGSPRADTWREGYSRLRRQFKGGCFPKFRAVPVRQWCGPIVAQCDACCDFIAGLLQVDPSRRMTIQSALAHPFIDAQHAGPPRAVQPRTAARLAGATAATPPAVYEAGMWSLYDVWKQVCCDLETFHVARTMYVAFVERSGAGAPSDPCGTTMRVACLFLAAKLVEADLMYLDDFVAAAARSCQVTLDKAAVLQMETLVFTLLRGDLYGENMYRLLLAVRNRRDSAFNALMDLGVCASCTHACSGHTAGNHKRLCMLLAVCAHAHRDDRVPTGSQRARAVVKWAHQVMVHFGEPTDADSVRAVQLEAQCMYEAFRSCAACVVRFPWLATRK